MGMIDNHNAASLEELALEIETTPDVVVTDKASNDSGVGGTDTGTGKVTNDKND